MLCLLSVVIHQIFELPQGYCIHLYFTHDSNSPAADYRCISCKYWQLTWFPEFPAQTTDSRQPTVRLSIHLSVRLSLCCRQTAAHISGNSPGRKCKSTAAKVFFGWNPRGMHRATNNDFKIHFQKGSKQYRRCPWKKQSKLDFERSVEERKKIKNKNY